MIYVTVGGTQFPFYRLINQIDKIALDFKDEYFIVQKGVTKYGFKSKNVKSIDFCTFKESEEYIKSAKIIISHAGTGTIVQSRQYAVPLIIVPRLKKYKEHVNDHQLDIVSQFEKSKLKGISVVRDIKFLENELRKVLSTNEKWEVKLKGKENIIRQIKKIIIKETQISPVVLLINPMDITYGSTHRIRQYLINLKKWGWQIKYIESNYTGEEKYISITQKNNLFGFLYGTLQRIYYSFILHYDILLIQTVTPLTVLPIFIARIRRKKVVIDWDDLSYVLQKNKIRAFFVKLCEHNFIKLSDIVFVPNRYLQKYGNNIGCKNMLYIPHGVDYNLFDPDKYNPIEVKRKIGLNDNKVLGFLASFTPGGVNDLDFIYTTVKKVMQQKPDINFLVIGGGPLFTKYKNMAKKIGLKNTLFTGFVEQEKIPEYISCIDVALIFMRNNLSNKMKTSLKVGEYLAMKKIVVGHIVGETKDIFGQWCVLCEPTEESFINKILAVLDNRIEKIDTNDVRTNIVKNFSWEKPIKIAEQSLKNLLN